MLLSQELKAKLDQLRIEANALMNKEGVTAEEINAKAAEIDTLKAKINYQEKVEADEAAAAQAKIDNGSMDPLDTTQKEHKNIDIKEVFAKAIAKKDLTDEENAAFKNLVIEGDPKKGGVAIPADISTDIKVYQDATRFFDIRPYVTIEPVETLKGSRPYATNQPEASGFASVDEGTDIQALYEPTFDSMDYQVRKYAGRLPATNELLDDSAYAIYNYLVKWLGENELNTYAYQIFNGTGTKSAQGIITEATKDGGALVSRTEKIKTVYTKSSDFIDKFIDVIDVDLETLVSDNIKIHTNSNGWAYIRKLKNAQGDYYLQKDVSVKSGKTFLDCEAIKVPKKFLGNITDGADTLVPFIIGDLRQLYTMYDRKLMSVQSTNVGGEAWVKDLTELKGIFRFDGKIMPSNVQAVKILLIKLQ